MYKILILIIVFSSWSCSLNKGRVVSQSIHFEYANNESGDEPIVKEMIIGPENNKYKLHFVLEEDRRDTMNYYKINIFHNEGLIYSDMTSLPYYVEKKSIRIQRYKYATYLFCKYNVSTDLDKWRIFVIKRGKFSDIVEVEVNIGLDFIDIDEGGQIEFGRLPQHFKSYCNNCDSIYYISNHIYQIGTRIIFDSLQSMEANLRLYGRHIDFSRGKYTISKRFVSPNDTLLKYIFRDK